MRIKKKLESIIIYRYPYSAEIYIKAGIFFFS